MVTFKPDAESAGRAVRFDWPYVMTQRDIAFAPHVLIVPVGADVAFPNQDKVRHHVYSFSPVKRFQLKLYGREESRTVRFDKPGVIALGCNIHDQMSGFIVAVDTPFAAKSDQAGRATLKGLTNGPGVLSIWQSTLKAPGNMASQPIVLRGDAQQVVTLDLRPTAKSGPTS